ncbi:hypothetical protein ABK040_006577 [Willaertia magna]
MELNKNNYFESDYVKRVSRRDIWSLRGEDGYLNENKDIKWLAFEKYLSKPLQYNEDDEDKSKNENKEEIKDNEY